MGPRHVGCAPLAVFGLEVLPRVGRWRKRYLTQLLARQLLQFTKGDPLHERSREVSHEQLPPQHNGYTIYKPLRVTISRRTLRD